MSAEVKLSTMNEMFDISEHVLSIRDRSLFSHFSIKAIRKVLKMGEIKIISAKSGEEFNRSLSPDCLYIVVTGRVVCVQRRTGMRIVECGPGKSIEFATVMEKASSWRYDWLVTGDAIVLQVPALALQTLFDSEENLQLYFERLVLTDSFHVLKKDLKLRSFREKAIRKLICAFRLVDLSELEQYDDSIWVMNSGRCQVMGEFDHDIVKLGEFYSGDFLFRDGSVENCRIEVEEGTEVFVLPKAEVLEIMGADKGEELIKSLNVVQHRIQSILSVRTKASLDPYANMTFRDDIEEDNVDLDHFRMEKESGEGSWLQRKRYRIVRQHDKMDCGAACLAMIARHFGKKLTLSFVRQHVAISIDGASMSTIRSGARALGFECIGVASGLKGLRKLRGPMVALCQYHFVVIYEINDESIWIGDPAVGLREMSHERFKAMFSSNVLLFEPTERLHQLKSPRMDYLKYFKILKGHRKVISLIFIMTLVTFVLGLISPAISQVLYDKVFVTLEADKLPLIMGALVAMMLWSQVTGIVHKYLATELFTKADAKFGALFLRHLYRLPLVYFAVRNVGDFTTRMGELTLIRGFMSNKPIQLTMTLLSVFIYGAAISLFSVKLLYVILFFMPFTLGVTFWVAPKLKRLSEENYVVEAKSMSLVNEQVQGLKSIQNICGGIAARWRWQQCRLESIELSEKSVRLNAYVDSINTFISEGMNQAVFIVSVFLIINDELSIGQMIACSMLIGGFVAPLKELMSEYSQFVKISVSFGRVDDVITALPEENDITGLQVVPEKPAEGKIEFQGVSFQYGCETSPLILDDVSLTIEPGQIVAFVGRSGSGKTTLASLINLMYRPTKGRILIDGVPNNDLSMEYLRQNVGFVMQDRSLFSGTIFDNITLGDEKAQYSDVVRAAIEADAYEFILDLPKGIQSELGEKGEGLSGGQRQRISIARALYRDPKILVMDEATSALDMISEKNIISSVGKGKGGRTTILIAHRLNTITYADKIFVLDHGKIVESGTHTELMARHEIYFDLFSRQSLGF